MSLSSRINNKTATIGIVGLGYVGLPHAVAFAATGFPVIGIDVNGERVA
ncbi:MAG: UDP-N-acetyl-D-glucosamine dehydrogenase, partial [Anaerolineae bacterium]|nr:UDP-N-acetyl-D-glucosamine dehydrogenase [Anaerolineae bacterium]